MIAAIAPPLIAMSTRRALPGNRALVIIAIIACTCHPASDQKVMGACGRNIVHIRSRLGCLASYTNPLHRTPPPNCVASPSASRLNRLSSVHASLL